MPTITPASIPTKTPGDLFSSLSGGDPTLNIRWLVSADPVFYEVLNRPLADLTVRQLTMAKTIDALSMSQGHINLYPYVIQPRVSSGTTEIDVPLRWIWDMHASLPKKWENLRLAKIKRISGTNSPTEGYTGELRIIFTANVENSSTEVAIFSADYNITSFLTYQPVRLTVVTSAEEPTPIDPTEIETVAGFLMFRTLELDEQDVQAFLDLLAPPTGTSATINSEGYYDNPTVYEIADSPVGGPTISGDFATFPIVHGTGLLTDSAWNPIPNLDTDVQSWINTFNYPYDTNATLTSEDAIVIPRGLFQEFNITAPAGDLPTGDTSGTYYPVWVSRIERVDDAGSRLRFYFATYNITDAESGGSPSTAPVEFATLDLLYSYTADEIVALAPINNLLLKTGTDAEDFNQHFGRGHVKLSSLWATDSSGSKIVSDVTDFFNSFISLTGTPTDTYFTIASTRVSSYGISRVPKYVPTIGQSQALLGSTSRRNVPLNPAYDNRYVTEADQGLGDQIDLDSQTGIVPNSAIERYGYSGALGHKIVRLVVDATAVGSSPTFYDTEVLPRLRILLGRDPQFGDFWWNGTRIMFFNGDTFQG